MIPSIQGQARPSGSPVPAHGGRPSPRSSEGFGGLRSSLFVGRSAELSVFRESLRGGPHRVLIVAGGKGRGKTALLREFAQVAREAGIAALSVGAPDAATPGAPGSDLPRIGAAALRWVRTVVPTASSSPVHSVILIDGLEELRLPALEDLLGKTPLNVVVVLAVAHPPTAQWFDDPGWQPLARLLPLDNLGAVDGAVLLARLAVPAGRQQELLAQSAGHPRSLMQLARYWLEAGAHPDFARSPELLDAFFESLMGEPPGTACEQALFACAHSGVTTAEQLSHLLEPTDVRSAWTWLSSLGVVEHDPDGLRLTPYARNLVDARFRHCWPERWFALHTEIHDAARRSIGHGQPRLQSDLRSARGLFSGHPVSSLSRLWGSAKLAAVRVERGNLQRVDAALGLLEQKVDAGEFALVTKWLAAHPEGLYVAEDRGKVVGTAFVLTHAFDRPTPVDDPLAGSILADVQQKLPRRPGQCATLLRFAAGEADGGADVFTAVAGCVTEWLGRRPAIGIVRLPSPDDSWRAALNDLAMIRVCAGRAGGGESYAVDFRRISPDSWYDFLIDNEFRGNGGIPETCLGPAPLDRTDFERAVGEALRDLANPSRLGTSPLIHSAALDPTAPRELALRHHIVAACRSIGIGEKDRKLARVLELSFVEPAVSKRVAAKRLDLPLSTFRRYLKEGVRRVTEELWAVELGDRPVASPRPAESNPVPAENCIRTGQSPGNGAFVAVTRRRHQARQRRRSGRPVGG